jgi:hypothetical protein
VERQADTLLSRQITQFFISRQIAKEYILPKRILSRDVYLCFESPKKQISTYCMIYDGLYNTVFGCLLMEKVKT